MHITFKTRFFALLLAFSVFVPLLVGISIPSFASTMLIPNAGTDELAQRAGMLSSTYDYLTNSSGNGLSLDKDFGDYARISLSELSCHPVNEVSYRDLERICSDFNSSFASKLLGAYERYGVKKTVAESVFGGWQRSKTGYAIIALDQVSYNTAIYRLRSSVGGEWIVNADGSFPYALAAGFNPEGDDGLTSATTIYTKPDSANKWQYVQYGDIDLASFARVSYDTLSTAAKDLGVGISVRAVQVNGQMVKMYYIYKPENGGAYYCDMYGHPFAAPVEADKTAVENHFTYNGGDVTIKNNSDNQTTEVTDSFNIDTSKNFSQVFDINAGKFVLVDENGNYIEQNIDSIYYDASTNTYTADTYNYTFNTENNYYEINYYTYNIQYTYNNTYVTYIGSTAEYQPKEWALYYELPDGRSSADLTEEDIAGLSFQFQDMVNYKRSATDTSLRALYHFDGNVEDSSYWSTQGAFTWNSGASITYMESNAFNGALYLDEKEHQFTITLPSNIGSQDFSLQWRYYQNSATTTDHNENYVSIGGTKLLGWSEQSLYSLGSTKLSTGLSVGTWQELALVRNGGTLYIYHNGVKVASASMSTVLNNKIVFYLGANSRAYSMIDELRFVNFSITKGGAAYTPTAVPYDTNNVLVLPDGAFPVADEYWEWDKTIKPIYSLDLTTSPSIVPDGESRGSSPRFYKRYLLSSSPLLLCSSYSSAYVSDGFISITGNGSLPELNFIVDCPSRNRANISVDVKNGGFALYLGLPIVSVGDYTATIVDSELNYYSIPFSFSKDRYSNLILSAPKVSFSWGSAQFSYTKQSYNDFDDNDQTFSVEHLLIAPNSGTSLDVIYIEIVKGDTPNTDHKKVSAVFSSDELQPNTAAIQSTIPVKGYTVGGVRPTFPERGDVWMPVEGSRISGVYIYNGQAWEETNARYWTGKRWIPIYAFDLVTLQDMWDVGSSTGQDVSPPISSEYGFWNWWQKAWNDFTAKLFPALGTGSGGGGSGSGSGTIPEGSLPGESGNQDEDDDWSVFDLLKALKDGTWAIVKGTVKTVFGGIKGVVGIVTDIGGFFTVVGDVSDTIKDFGG